MPGRTTGAFVPVYPLGKRAFLFALQIAVTLAPAGCERQHTGTYERRSPERIVSLLPAATDALVALGKASSIVGRTAYDTAAALAQAVSFGQTLAPSPEAVLALHPDLVILPAFLRRAAASRTFFETHGINVLSPQIETIRDVDALIDTLGRRFDAPDKASALRDSIRLALLHLRAVRHARIPTVLFLIWHDPVTAAGAGTFVDELIAAAGGRNAAAAARGQWPEMSLESVIRSNPDFIIIPRPANSTFTAELLAKRPGWSSMKAFRNGHVIEVPRDLFERPGPRVADAARILARAIHPEAQLQ